MQKYILCLVIAMLSLNGYAQITFEKGYFIDDSNQKTNCLIRNVDWKNNPSKLDFKLTPSGKIETATIQSIKEFGIDDSSKFIRSTVNIDRSDDRVEFLSDTKKPIFHEEELFLRVLVEGKGNLYQYVDGNMVRYFYKKDDENIQQLVYKKYKIKESYIAENNGFRQQLWINFKCSYSTSKNIEGLNYTKNDLVNFFIDYNKCEDVSTINYRKDGRDFFNLSLRPRINSSSLKIKNLVADGYDIDFGNQIGLGVGVEFEFILPFNKDKWGVIIEPTYQKFKSDKSQSVDFVSGGQLLTEVDYSSIEIPMGIRHYFFLNDNSKIFVNASYVIDFKQDSSIDFIRSDGSELNSLDIKTDSNWALGLGYNYNNKYSLELRYQTEREVLDYNYWASKFKSISFILGYSIF